MMPRTVFMGSPVFALPILRDLAGSYSVVGVVTQPDRPAGRGRQLSSPPIKLLADDLRLPVIQPRKLSLPETIQQLRKWKPELIVVAAFGQILRPEVLDLPRYGCINVHASLLPRWRGAAPIQAAILAGDVATGVTIMRMNAGVDTGPMLNQRSIEISLQETAGSLSSRLSDLGALLLMETLPEYLAGKLNLQPQDESGATYASMIKKGDGLLDFTLTASELERRIRAYNPWPSAYTYWNNQILKIHCAHAVYAVEFPPGERIVYHELPAIGTRHGVLVVDELQPAGKNALDGKSFLRGARNWVS